MKSFQQFMEQVTPKHYDKIPVTIDDAITNRFIRTLDMIDKSNKKFRKGTGFNLPLPLAKKKNRGEKSVMVIKVDKSKEFIKSKVLISEYPKTKKKKS